MKKRLLSVLLALCMLLTMLPATAFAADSGTVETKVSVCNTNLPFHGRGKLLALSGESRHQR